jgi:hypothetical protein
MDVTLTLTLAAVLTAVIAVAYYVLNKPESKPNVQVAEKPKRKRAVKTTNAGAVKSTRKKVKSKVD